MLFKSGNNFLISVLIDFTLRKSLDLLIPFIIVVLWDSDFRLSINLHSGVTFYRYFILLFHRLQ